jgi:hypothetical protein
MPKPTPDLRTSNVPIEIQRYSNLHGLQEQAQRLWGLRRIQPYFPSIQKLFKLDEIRNPYSYGIRSRYAVQTIVDADTLFVGGKEQKVHLKKTMIFAAYNVMRGDYAGTGLPHKEDEATKRLQSPYNAAYVGSLASIALSESGCQHFPKVFGVFSGIAASHVLDISDDYEDLCDRAWFSQNIGHFFELRLKKPSSGLVELEDMDGPVDLGIQDLQPVGQLLPPPPPQDSDNNETSEDDDENDADDEHSSYESGNSTDYVFDVRSCSTDDSMDEENGFEEPEDDEAFAHAVFEDAPIQITAMEKCDGTFYKLFKENPDGSKRYAWVLQVVFALAYAQRTFGLVHNDLHVMNVMYVPTESEFLYYNLGGRTYRIPTFGKLMKIIDFDRATLSVKLPKMRDSKFFMSDQFEQEEEAGGQYNTQPFYNPKYPEVKPNPSFDLVRLASSIFLKCFPEGKEPATTDSAALYKLFKRWLTLPDGSSVLFRTDGIHERFRGFQLYKAIARFARDAVPRKQIEHNRIADEYLFTEKLPMGVTCLLIEP